MIFKLMPAIGATILLSLTAAPAAIAQASDAAAAAPALVRLPARGGAMLTVTSPSIKAGGDIDLAYTQYRGNTFPGLAWTKGPKGTVSYAIVMQDTDLVVRGGPVLHWVLFNIPANVTTLAKGMTARPAGSTYGPNYKGKEQPYLGPRTPPGPKHHYHLQVFALDTKAPAEARGSLQVLMDAMKGHVLASGELVGLAQADPRASPPAPK
jgi:para-nitrobenzyl esterase